MKLRAIFQKKGDIRFISHLDVIRLFQRASRRARLPVSVTKGFSPRLKINVTRALKLGLEAESEEAIFFMDAPAAPGDFVERINAKLPGGINITTAEEME